MSEQATPMAVKASEPGRRFHVHMEKLVRTIECFKEGCREDDEPALRAFGNMLLCEGVNRFLSYLSSLMGTVLEKNPKALRAKSEDQAKDARQSQSEGSYDLTFILEHKNMDDLVSAIIEDRVYRKSMESLDKVCKFFEKVLSFELLSGQELQDMRALVACRNILAHNNGIINRRFLWQVADTDPARVGVKDPKLGAEVFMDMVTIAENISYMEGVVRSVDKRALKKWRLPPHEFKSRYVTSPESPEESLPQ